MKLKVTLNMGIMKKKYNKPGWEKDYNQGSPSKPDLR